MILVIIHKTDLTHEWVDILVNESFSFRAFFSVDDFDGKENALFTIKGAKIGKDVHIYYGDIVSVNGSRIKLYKNMSLDEMVSQINENL